MNREHLRPAIGTIAVYALCVLAAPVAARAQTAPAGASQSPARTVVAPATVAAFFSTDLYAKDSGYISQVSADIGDRVKQGQVLATIDDPELEQQSQSAKAMLVARQEMARAAEAAVAQGKAAVDVARQQHAGLEADRELSQVTLKRQEELFAGKAATVQQMDDIRARAQVATSAAEVGKAKIAAAEADLHLADANRAVAEAQVHVAEAEVQRLATLLQYTKIVAPFDGVVTRRMVNQGDLAQSATTARTSPLFTCQKLDVVRVQCDVPEADVLGIAPGAPAEVRLHGAVGAVVRGTVTRISTSLDAATRTMRVEIDLPNPDGTLRAGMYADVTLTPAAPAAAK